MKNYLILFSILIVALFTRFNNFENRITFGPEQARSLIVSANYIQYKPSLLGQEYFRTNSMGHKLFTSAIFNYSLVPLILMTNYDPLPITIYFSLLNIFTGFVLFLIAKKVFNQNIALFSLVLFLFNSYMIYHSMFIWVLNYLPLIGITSFYYIWKLYKNKYKWSDIFILGVLSGIGFGLEYLYIIFIFIIFYFLIKYSKKKAVDFTIFALGGGLGDITQVLFDIKHDLYHLRTLWQYALDTFNGISDASFTYYHFLHFWPIGILIIAFGLWQIYKKSKLFSFALLFLYLFLNLTSPLINFNKPVGMVDGLKYKDLRIASKLIADNANDNFNLVTLYDFDTRGYTLRYFVRYFYNKLPLSEIEYQNASEIFALSKVGYDYTKGNPWELNVYKPYNVKKVENIGDGYALYKLTK